MSRLGEAVSTLRFLWTHPLASRNRRASLTRWLRWQLGSRLLGNASVVVPFVNDAVLVVERGMTGATGNVYTGLHEFSDMAFLLHFLRDGDLFVDVGANVGSYTVLAAAVTRCRCVAVEPLPRTFNRLLTNIRVNALDERVDAHNLGLAGKRGLLRFTEALDTTNHVLADDEASTSVAEVSVTTLDELLDTRAPTLIKIDVEGFETEVIAGATRTLASPSLRALIIELNGSGARYGFDESALQRRFMEAGFTPCVYEPFNRTLSCADGERDGGNIIYVRDVEDATKRLSTAPPFSVLGLSI